MDIEKEFLIAVSNNSVKLLNYIETLVENILTFDILTEDEIREYLSKKKLISVIGMLTNYAIFRFVNENSETIINSFNENFVNVDLKAVLIEVNVVFEKYEQFMFFETKKKLWIEILRTCCFYYLKRLVYGNSRKPKTIDVLTSKIKTDLKFLFEAFLNKLGEYTIKENLKNLEKILEFLETPIDMISLSCYSLREFIGPTFSLDMVKSLIDLRVDWPSSDKKSAIVTCKQVLDNYKADESEAKKNPLLEYILLERKNMAKRISHSDSLESVEEIEKNERKIDNIRRGTLNISDFLCQINEIPESLSISQGKKDQGNSDNKENTSNPDKVGFVLSNINKDVTTKDADVIYSGYMEKKSEKA